MTNIIRQPNKITYARYDFSATQKNLIYRIYAELQKELEFQKSLFDQSRKYTFDVSTIVKDNDYRHLINEAKDLMIKPFEYDWIDDTGRKNTTATVLIASATHPYGTSMLTIEVPAATLPVLLYVGEGFTALQMTVAICLKSKHSKRLYEMCCRWKDRGGFSLTLDEFRKMLCIEKQYTKVSMLQTKVLDFAQKELKEAADVWFDYDLEKVKSRSFNHINFKIFSNDVKQANAEKGVYPMVYNFLIFSFPNMFNDKALVITNKLEEKQQLATAWGKFKPIWESFKAGEIKDKHLVNTTKKILREDFGIETDEKRKSE